MTFAFTDQELDALDFGPVIPRPPITPAGPPSRSLIGDLYVAGKRGMVGVPEMFLKAGAGVDEVIDKMSPEPDLASAPGNFDLKRWARSKREGLEAYKERTMPLSAETLAGGPRQWLTGGIESAVTSLGAKAPGAAAGAGVGMVLGGPPGALTFGILGYLAGVPLFSMAQYDEALRNYQAQGLTREEAEMPAILEAASEGGTELLSDVIELATLGGGKVLTVPAKSALKQGVTQVLRNSWRQAVKKGGIVAGAETTGELLNTGMQAEIQREHIPEAPRFWDAVQQNLGSITVASLIFGTLAGGLAMTNIRQVRKALTDPEVDQKQRLAAVKSVGDVLHRVSPEIGRQWSKSAYEAVLQGKALDLTAAIDSDPAAAAPLRSQGRGIKDIARPPPADTSTEENQAAAQVIAGIRTALATGKDDTGQPFGRANYEQLKADPEIQNLGVTDEDLAAIEMEFFGQPLDLGDQSGLPLTEAVPLPPEVPPVTPPGVEAPVVPPAAAVPPAPGPESELAALEAQLTPGQVAYIRSEMERGGGLEQVQRAYPDDELVADYARLLAAQMVPPADVAAANVPEPDPGPRLMVPPELEADFKAAVAAARPGQKDPFDLQSPEAGGGEPPAEEETAAVATAPKPRTDIVKVLTGKTGKSKKDSIAGKVLKHFTTQEGQQALESGKAFDFEQPPQHGTGSKGRGDKTGRFAGQRLYLSLDDKAWGKATRDTGGGEEIVATEETMKQHPDAASFYDYEDQRWMLLVGGMETVDLHPVSYKVKPGIRELKIDSPEAYDDIVNNKYRGLYSQSPEFWDRLAKDYDAVVIRNVEDSIEKAVPDSGAYDFFGAVRADQVIILNPDVVEIVRPKPAPTTDKSRTDIVKVLTGKRGEALAGYREYVASLTDEERERVKDLIEEEPKSPSLLQRQIQAELKKRQTMADVTPEGESHRYNEKYKDIWERKLTRAGRQQVAQKLGYPESRSKELSKTGWIHLPDNVHKVMVQWLDGWKSLIDVETQPQPLTKPPQDIILQERPASEMTADDLLAEWVRQAAQAEPAPAPAEPGVKATPQTTKKARRAEKPKEGPPPEPVELEVRSLETGKTETVTVPEPTAREKAKEVKDHLANAMQAFADINNILGEEGALSTEDIDEAKWEQIKPLLKLAWDEIVAAGKSGQEFVRIALKALSPKGRPYFEKFVREEIVKEKEDGADAVQRGELPVGGDQAALDDREKTGSDRGPVSEGQKGAVRPVAGGGGTRPGEVPQDKSGGEPGPGSDRRDHYGDSGAGGGRVSGETDAGRDARGDNGLVRGGVGVVRRVEQSSEPLAPEDRNHVIEDDDIIVPRGDETKIKANIKAIQLFKKLRSEDRKPTLSEKKILAQYVGWGQFSEKIFNKKFADFAVRSDDDTVPTNNRDPSQWFYEDKGKAYNKWKEKYGKKLHPTLGGLLTEEEWKSAEASTINAHYTTRTVINAMWSMARRMGFTGGTVLEPAAGVGHFFGLMPQNLAQASALYGVEKDTISGGIFQELYPQAHIQIKPFERVKSVLDNSIDLVITNVPFGNIKIIDKKHPHLSGWSLHNYFFGRSLDVAKPGGLVMGITSSWTMDAKSGGEIRAKLAQRADLVAAFRLPNTAFKENAGTEVVTDILIFRKKDSDATTFGDDFRVSKRLDNDENKRLETDLETARRTIEKLKPQKGVKDTKERKLRRKQAKEDRDKALTAISQQYGVNEYFHQHPDNVLGRHATTGTMYKADAYTVEPLQGASLEYLLEKAAKNWVPANIAGEGANVAQARAVKYAALDEKEGTLTREKGKIYLVENGRLITPYYLGTDSKKKKHAITGGVRLQRLEKYLDLRLLVERFIGHMGREDATDDEIASYQKKLNTLYDDYVQKYGAFNTDANSFIGKVDNGFAIVDALEITKKGSGIIEKAPIFTRRTVFPFKEPGTASSIEDATNLSMVYRGGLRPQFIADLLGSDDTIEIKRLLVEKGLAFINPATGLIEQRDLYLSGNVKKKLREAKAAAEDNPALAANVDALASVVPPDVYLAFIDFRLGSSWVPSEAIADFMKDTLGVEADVKYSKTDIASRYEITLRDHWKAAQSVKNKDTYGTRDYKGHELVEKALNFTRAIVKREERSPGGGTRVYTDEDATREANIKINELNDEFQAWGKTHSEWAPKLHRAYNDEKNGHVLRKHTAPKFIDADGNQTPYYPNASRGVVLRESQKIAISRALQESVLLAYGVGTGKTFIYITTAMEMRRIGTARKPLIVVHNQTIDQYRTSFKVLYPGARVLIPNTQQRSRRMRRKTLTSMATGDWDCIVLPQSFFDGIANDPGRETAFVEELLEMLDAQIAQVETEEGKKSLKVKELVKLKERKRQRLEALLDRQRDEALRFEQMGIDALLIDEVHAYKRSEFFTKMDRVKGIDNGASQRSTSLILKSEYVREKTGNKNVITATGTPISNTMAELWTMLRYVRPDLLKEYGVELFDDFAGTFGRVVEGIEETASGYKEVERFAEYVNGPELLTMFFSGADVRLTKDVEEIKDDLPKIKGGKPQVIAGEKSPALDKYIQDIITAWRDWEDLPGREKMKARHVPLVLYGRAKKAAVDLRLIDPKFYPDDPNAKLSVAAEKIHEIWQRTADNRSTQIVFLDVIRNAAAGGTFNTHNEIRRKLVEKGIPEHEVLLFGEAGTNEKKQEAMKEKIIAGTARVIIGSRARLGVGVDIAKKLIAAHHINVPDRPMDIEQSDGRIIRFGNENPEVEIFHYCTRDTLDSVMFGRLLKKQRFSDQILSGDISGRSFKDPYSAEQASFAEFAAAASGKAGKLLFEKNELIAEAQKHKVAKTAWIRKVSNANEQLRELPQAIEKAQQDLKEATALKAEVERDFVDLKIDRVEFEGETVSRGDFLKALTARINTIRDRWKKELAGMSFGDYRELLESRKQSGSWMADVYETIEAAAKGFGIRFKVKAWTNYDLDQAVEKPSTKLRFASFVKNQDPDYSGETEIETPYLRDLRMEITRDGKALAWSAFAADNLKANFTRNYNEFLSKLATRPGTAQAWIKKTKAEIEEYKSIAKEGFKYADQLKAAERRIKKIDAELLKLTRGGSDTTAESPYDYLSPEEAELKHARLIARLQEDISTTVGEEDTRYSVAWDRPEFGDTDTVANTIEYARAFFESEYLSSLETNEDALTAEEYEPALETLRAAFLEREHALRYPRVIGPREQYATSTTPAAAEKVTAADIRAVFPGQDLFQAEDGTVSVHTRGGGRVRIKTVKWIDPTRMEFEVAYARAPKQGEKIAGRYREGSSTIELVRDYGDRWTLTHESVHWMEDVGILTPKDVAAVRTRIRQLHNNGRFETRNAQDVGGKEDRAVWITAALRAGEKHKGPIAKILKKVADWIDRLVSLVHRTGRGVVRDIESGRIFSRPATVESGEGQTLFAVIDPQQVTADLEKNRTFAKRIFEQRDVGIHHARQDTADLQKEVQRLAGKKSRRRHPLGFAYDKELKRSRESDRLEMAMMVWRDLQINPDKAEEFKAWAQEQLAAGAKGRMDRQRIWRTREQLDLLQRVENLSDEQKALADAIGERFTAAFRIARANKVVSTFLDHYVRRIWNLPEGKEENFKSSGSGYGFKTFTTASKQRTFETIPDGWMAGYDLKVKGLTSAYGNYMEELETIVANKDFIRQGYHTRDLAGRRLFSTRKSGEYKDYVALQASGFKVWEWAGQVGTEVEPDEDLALMVDDHGRKFFFGAVERTPEIWAVYKVGGKGTGKPRALRLFYSLEDAREFAAGKDYETRIQYRKPKDIAQAWEERRLYAPRPLAEIVNKMTAADRIFFDTPGLQALARFNAGMKSWVLLSSFFHHMAGARSWAFGVHHGWKPGKIKDPLTGEIIETAGMNPVRAYKAGLRKIEERAPLIQLLVKNGLTLGEMQDWAEQQLRDQKGIAETIANRLGLERTSKLMEKGRFVREQFTNSLFRKYFAGLKAEAAVMEFVHELQKAQNAYLKTGGKAPDIDLIAEQVADLINSDFGGLHLGRMGRNPTLQKFLRLILLAPDWTESNFRTVTGMIPGLNDFIGRMAGDIPAPKGMDRVYRDFWARVALRIAVSTILTQMLLNGPDDSEDFWREQALGNRFNKKRWLEVDITKIYHALGIDTADRRKALSLGGHFFDPLKLFDPPRLIKHKGSPLMRIADALATATDWRERPFTGVKELVATGKTIKKSPHQEKESFATRLPATLINQVVNLQPVQVGYALRYLQGEQDGLSALLLSAGTAVHTAYPAKMEGPIDDAGGGDPVHAAARELKESGALRLGPPSRFVTIDGLPRKLSETQYLEYVKKSSDLVRRELKSTVTAGTWQRMTPGDKAKKIEAAVRRARSQVRKDMVYRIRHDSRKAK